METATHVLVVGWRGPSVRALIDLGASVSVIVSSTKAASAREMPGVHSVHVASDSSSVESCLAVLARDRVPISSFDAVCSGSEFSIVTAALLAQLGGAAGIPVDSAIGLRDKYVQKSRVRTAGVNVADTSLVESTRDISRPRDEPFVVKPLDGAGATDTVVLRSDSDAEAFAAMVDPAGGPWLLESFVHGWEVQVDGIVRDGELLHLTVSRYLHNVIEVHDGALVGAIALHPDRHQELYRDVSAMVHASLSAIPHRDGVFHLEAFIDDDRVTFSECAGRVSGGMLDRTLDRLHGIDIHDAWARAAMGLPPRLVAAAPTRSSTCGDLYLSPPAGVIRSMPSRDELLTWPGVVDCRVDVAPGSIAPDQLSASYLRAATVLVEGADENIVEQLMRDVAARFVTATVTDPLP